MNVMVNLKKTLVITTIQLYHYINDGNDHDDDYTATATNIDNNDDDRKEVWKSL